MFLGSSPRYLFKLPKNLFSSFGVYHQKLEIKAIQKYSLNSLIEYVPELENSLSDSFEKKYDHICNILQLQRMIDEFNSSAG